MQDREDHVELHRIAIDDECRWREPQVNGMVVGHYLRQRGTIVDRIKEPPAISTDSDGEHRGSSLAQCADHAAGAQIGNGVLIALPTEEHQHPIHALTVPGNPIESGCVTRRTS